MATIFKNYAYKRKMSEKAHKSVYAENINNKTRNMDLYTFETPE